MTDALTKAPVLRLVPRDTPNESTIVLKIHPDGGTSYHYRVRGSQRDAMSTALLTAFSRLQRD